MAVEQRIIGGGLLLVGIVIVLILIYFFTFTSDLTPEEARDTLLGEVFPAYQAALDGGDYLATKRRAQEVLDTLERGGRTATVKHLRAESTSGDREARILLDLLDAGTFQKNTQDRFQFQGGYYGPDVHRSLANLDRAIADDMDLLLEARSGAQQAGAALQVVREGSALALEPPPAEVPADDAPVVDPNPVYQNDAALYRSLGVPADAVRKALATPGEGARAKSARLRWNKRSAGERSRLTEELAEVPRQARELERLSVEVQRNVRNLANAGEAADAVRKLLDRAVAKLGTDLVNPHRKAFEENRARFVDGEVVSQVLRQEARMLKAYAANAPDLGRALAEDFAAP